MDIQILDKLYSNRYTLTELSTAKILGTKVNASNPNIEVTEAIRENEKLTKLFIKIEDEITGLVVEDEELAFLYGMCFGSIMGTRINERESAQEIVIENSTKKVKMIEYYNYVKELAGYKTEEKVSNYKNVFMLKECTSDEAIESVIKLFYNSKSTFEDVKEAKSDEYIKRYRKLLFMESEFIMEISDSLAETFTRFVRAEKEDNNYILVNAYFNGFRVGARLMRDFNNIYKEIEKQCEERKENISNS